MAAVKSTKPTSKLKAGQKKKVNKWLIIGGVGAVAIIGAVIVRFSSAATCTKVSFSQGSSGQCVKDIQGLVNTNYLHDNTSKYLVVDGKYGPKTRDYIKLFQASRFLPATGTVTKSTWEQLCSSGSYSKNPVPQWAHTMYVYGTNAGCWK